MKTPSSSAVPALASVVCIRDVHTQSSGSRDTGVSMMQAMGLLGAVDFVDIVPGDSRLTTHVKAARIALARLRMTPDMREQVTLIVDTGVRASDGPLARRLVATGARTMLETVGSWHIVMLGWSAMYDPRARDVLFGSTLGCVQFLTGNTVNKVDDGDGDGDGRLALVGPVGGFDPSVYLLSRRALEALASANGDDASMTLARWMRKGWRTRTLCAAHHVFSINSTSSSSSSSSSSSTAHTDVLTFLRQWRAPISLLILALVVMLSLAAALHLTD